jgi:hypothetical protein
MPAAVLRLLGTRCDGVLPVCCRLAIVLFGRAQNQGYERNVSIKLNVSSKCLTLLHIYRQLGVGPLEYVDSREEHILSSKQIAT